MIETCGEVPATVRIARLRENGRALLRAGDPAQALPIFKEMVDVDPRDPQVHEDLGGAALASGRFEAAAEAYAAALKIEPHRVDCLRGLGHSARRQGDRGRALQHFQAARETDPGKAKHHHEVGEELRALGRSGEAAEAFDHALSLDPLFRPALLGRAALASACGDDDRALGCFTEAARLGPPDAQLARDLAATLHRLGRLDEAEAAFRSIVEVDAEDRGALLGLAGLARQRGDHQAALDWLTKAAACRDDPRLALEVAKARVALGSEPDEAYGALLDGEGTRHAACLELSREARRRGDSARALSWLERAATTAPEDRETCLALCKDYRRRWDLDTADARLDQFLAAAPDDAQALVEKGLVARMRGRRDEARRLFETAYRLDSRAGGFELARECREARDLQGALAILERLSAERPDDPSVLVQLGLLARAAGDDAAAMGLFDQSIRKAPGHLSAYLEMAATARRLGQFAKVRDLLARAGAVRPAHPRVLEASADLALAADDATQALDLLRDALAADPTAVSAKLKLARCEAALGRPEDALATLDAARVADGGPDVILLKAQILKQQGRFREAAAAFAEGRAAFPFVFQLWFQNALFLVDTGIEPPAPLDIARAPASSAAERAKVGIVLGAEAAAAWDFSAARQHYLGALDGNEADCALHGRLATAALLDLDIATADRHLVELARHEAPLRRLRGQSLGPYQTLPGQILDEARIDAPGLERLVRARAAAEPDARRAALVEAARETPEMTLAAMQVMLALRRDGAFDRGSVVAQALPIPTEIVQFWYADTVPEDVQRLSATWAERNPGFAYRLFSGREADRFLSAEYPAAVVEAFRAARDPARKADLFRLAYLLRSGGVYADADDLCVASLAPLLGPGASLLVYQEDIGSIGNNVMAAAPSHPILRRALNLAVTSVLSGDNDIPWLSTGPGLLTRVMAQAVVEGGSGRLRECGIEILTRRELLPFVATCCMTAYKHTRRHWSRAAFLARPAQPTDRSSVPRDTLPEPLQQREA